MVRSTGRSNTFLAHDWADLGWSPWVALQGSLQDHQVLQSAAGVYRVRVTGRAQLTYVGQTGRSLRQRLRSLARHTFAEAMPFNDPHTAAPGHWALRVEEGLAFECSAAAVSLAKADRLGLEDRLLWMYRVEQGASTLCNHGRFHARYTKSKSRSSGKRGAKLPPDEANPAGGSSQRPLQLQAAPRARDWMGLVVRQKSLDT